MWLLSWLLGQVSKLFTVFGSLYNPIITAAIKAYGWAVSKASNALSAARSYALGITNSNKNRFTQLFNTAVSITSAVNTLMITKYNQNRTLIFLKTAVLKLDIKNRVSDAITTVKSWVTGFIADPIGWIQDNISAIMGVVKWVTGHMMLLAASIVKYAPLYWADNTTDIIAFLQQKKDILLTFLSDPIGYVIAVIDGYILVMLEWLVAYALGTVEASMPNKPKFKDLDITTNIPTPRNVPGRSGLISQPLSSIRVSGNRFSQSHPGVDLGLVTGQSVFTIHAGRVSFVKSTVSGEGIYVVVSGDGIWSRYFHLSRPLVNTGDKVVSGQRIGLGGSTGYSTGPHLHLETKINGVYVDPLQILA